MSSSARTAGEKNYGSKVSLSIKKVHKILSWMGCMHAYIGCHLPFSKAEKPMRTMKAEVAILPIVSCIQLAGSQIVDLWY